MLKQLFFILIILLATNSNVLLAENLNKSDSQAENLNKSDSQNESQSYVSKITGGLELNSIFGGEKNQISFKKGLGYDFLYENQYIYIGALQSINVNLIAQGTGFQPKDRGFGLRTLREHEIDYQLNLNYGLGSRYIGYFGLAYDVSLREKFAAKGQYSLSNKNYSSSYKNYIDTPSYLYGYYITPRVFGFTTYINSSIALTKYKNIFRPRKINIEQDKYNSYLDQNKYYAYRFIPESNYDKVSGWGIGFDYEINVKGIGLDYLLDGLKLYENTIIQQNSGQKTGFTLGINSSYLITTQRMNKLLDDFKTWIPYNRSKIAGKSTETFAIMNLASKLLYYAPGNNLSKLNLFAQYNGVYFQTPRLYYDAFKNGDQSPNKLDRSIINDRGAIDLSGEMVLFDKLLYASSLYSDFGSIWALSKTNNVGMKDFHYVNIRFSLINGYYFNNIILENDSLLIKAIYYYDSTKFDGKISENHNIGLGFSYDL